MLYGTGPRLAMIHVSAEAVRNESPVIGVGHSKWEFLITPRHRADEPGEQFLAREG